MSVIDLQPNRGDVSRRAVSGVAGLVVVIFGILLQTTLPEHPTTVQVILWTTLVFVMIALGNYRQHRENWFWKAMLFVVLVHVIVLLTFRPHLPFSSLGIAILLSAPEAILLQAVVILTSQTFSD
jgi:FtsH-binding integral membrane protein